MSNPFAGQSDRQRKKDELMAGRMMTKAKELNSMVIEVLELVRVATFPKGRTSNGNGDQARYWHLSDDSRPLGQTYVRLLISVALMFRNPDNEQSDFYFMVSTSSNYDHVGYRDLSLNSAGTSREQLIDVLMKLFEQSRVNFS